MTDRTAEVVALLAGCRWLRDVLAEVAAVDPPGWWVGAGSVRDIVWGERFRGGFDPADVKDVDVAYFDPDRLDHDRDAEVEAALIARNAQRSWDAKNQAAVHLWYPERFGVAVDPLPSTQAGVATWPETASAVAVRVAPGGGGLELCAPCGVDDLLDGVWRWNPVRCPRAEYERRLAVKRPAERWPGVVVAEP